MNNCIYLAGGCFWGMEEMLRQVPGVIATEVGYTGGHVAHVTYPEICNGDTGHAEAVKVLFDPQQLTLEHLLFEFFRSHNPTTLNQQGNDIGTQYRSAIFYLDQVQKQIAEQVIAKVHVSGEWKRSIVTQLIPFEQYWRAEDYHQQYLQKLPNGYNCHYRRDWGLGEGCDGA